MPATAREFLQGWLRSGLINRSTLEEELRAVPARVREDPERLAEHFIRTRILTPYQAKRLLAGKFQNLALGPYHVLTPLGKGGMGVVFQARDTRSQQVVALKVLPPKRAKEEQRLLARFRREMELSQRVAHPHLAWTYEAGVAEGVYFIAMEYVPGKTLQRLVQARGPLTVGRAARLLGEVAAALEHAHSQRLIHRDLKPSNVMISSHDHAKVLDLGLALIHGETEGAREVIGGRGYIVGTMDYISPEQTHNATEVDARSDLYSLGCSLYFALTGTPPFPGGTPREKIQRHRTEDPRPPQEINPDIPEPIVELIYQLMAKRPQERPANAAVVEQTLRNFTKGDGLWAMERKTDPEQRLPTETLSETEPSNSLLEVDIPSSVTVQPIAQRQLRGAATATKTGDNGEDTPVPPDGLLPSLVSGVSRNVQSMLEMLGIRKPR